VTQLVSYRGRVVGVAAPSRFYLAPDVEGLERGNPTRHLAVLMCVYARAVEVGELPGPYDERRAAACVDAVLASLSEPAGPACTP
jgi:hypothetical protein